MRKFHFSLERLLRLREHKEKDWEIKLGEATGRCVRTRHAINDREEKHRRVLADRVGQSRETLMAAELYMRRMRLEAAQLRQELEVAEAERLKIQVSYLEASRDRKVLEKLKEKKEKEYTREQLKKDFDILDEINSGAAARRQTHESIDGSA